MKKKISLALITLNEEVGLINLLPDIVKLQSAHQSISEIFAIDGGSTDQTLDLLKASGIPVHSQKAKGRGAALVQAADLAQYEYVIYFSPDGNENLRDIEKFFNFIEQDFDIIIASRMMPGSYNEEDLYFFRWRKWVNLIFNRTINILYKNEKQNYVTDSINGFRAVKKNLLKELSVDALDHSVEFQMSMRALRHNKKIAEFATREGQRLGGETKAKSFPTGLKFIRCLIKEIFTPIP